MGNSAAAAAVHDEVVSTSADAQAAVGGASSCSNGCPGVPAALQAETFALARVATLRSTFTSAFGCPRQGLAAPSVRGRIDLEPWMLAAHGGGGTFLEGLEGFSHVWVVFLFDQNRHSSASFDPSSSFLKPMVRPPWLSGSDGKRGSCGVFATRSPHRPNPVGLTVCCLDHVDHANGAVYISGVDVIDGSAVLDIKPYHPIDCLRQFGSRGERPPNTEDPTVGMIDAGNRPISTAARFPDWLPSPKPSIRVRWRGNTLEELERLMPQCSFYPDARDEEASQHAARTLPFDSLRAAVEEVLGLDPRTPQSRGKSSDSQDTTHRYWAFDFDAVSIAFRLLRLDCDDGGIESAFEVVSVELRSQRGLRTSKAWLQQLRRDLESDMSGQVIVS